MKGFDSAGDRNYQVTGWTNEDWARSSLAHAASETYVNNQWVMSDPTWGEFSIQYSWCVFAVSVAQGVGHVFVVYSKGASTQEVSNFGSSYSSGTYGAGTFWGDATAVYDRWSAQNPGMKWVLPKPE